MGPLHLALLAAQSPEGAAWLHQGGVLQAVAALARQLLHAPGSALSQLGALSLSLPMASAKSTASLALTRPMPPPPPADAAAAGWLPRGGGGGGAAPALIDTAGAYEAGEGPRAPAVWCRVHAHWCQVLALSGGLIRHLGLYVDVSGKSRALRVLTATSQKPLSAFSTPGG